MIVVSRHRRRRCSSAAGSALGIPRRLDPIWMLAKIFALVCLLHLGPRDPPPPPLRPADETRLEGPAAAGDAQRARHRVLVTLDLERGSYLPEGSGLPRLMGCSPSGGHDDVSAAHACSDTVSAPWPHPGLDGASRSAGALCVRSCAAGTSLGSTVSGLVVLSSWVVGGGSQPCLLSTRPSTAMLLGRPSSRAEARRVQASPSSWRRE